MNISSLGKAIKAGFSRLAEKDWPTVTALVGIFLLALFLRAFFGFDVATSDGFLLSGGSDSYYHKRVIDYVVATGQQPYIDYMLNYPIGLHSVRPPLYDWSVAVSGIAFSPVIGSVDVSVWYSFLFSTAIWGALTIFPLYFMTKEAFGRRVGLLAAFFLAIMPAHIQRSPFTNGDHDSFVLFFVVLTFYFFLKALKSLKEKEWIKTWKKPRAVLRDFRSFLVENRKPILYSAMAGLSIGAIALAWTGFSYVVVILLAFYIVQILLNRLKNRDSFGLIVCFTVTVGVALLVSLPFYASYLRISGWFDTPLYMLLIAIPFGMIFLLTKKYPWMMVVPSIFITFLIGLFVLSIFYPNVVHNFFSGFGYFLRTKAYETIAEAQPPTFSQLALSFGAVTFYLSIFGLAWSVIHIPKKMQSDYIFLVVWIALSIYMAMAAARFLFNGAPAFAMTSAWVTVLALDKIDIKGARKTYRSTGGNRFHAFRKSVKIRHIGVVLIMAFLIILPNVWFGIDASIPYEKKSEYDEEIYNTMPSIFRSENYEEGGLWYLGAFGYSLPVKSRYWPTAYSWLSAQEKDTPIPKDKPAILSWWDYGFEFIQEGKHPTVADNFLSGHQLAGNFIMSQNEKDAIALLTVRVIEGHYHQYNPVTGYQTLKFDDNVRALFSRYDLNASVLEDVFLHPNNYINAVKNNPGKYGPRSPDLSSANAKYLYLQGLLTDKFSTDELVQFYHDLRETTGMSIRYFAVDSRLFPFSAQVTGIFYAPAKLSDHRIDGGTPIDFYEIKAVSEFGAEYSLDEVPPGTAITDYKLVYKDMFYNSMFYRTFAGYSGKDVGQGDGIPSLSENLAQYQIMPGWNLNHFKVVYRTSYYNPYPPADVQNHSDDWRAINFEDGLELQRQIQEENATGTLDLSSRTSLQSGVVIIKYYDGAYINGTITIDGKTPFSGVTVTITDEFGIPHYAATTDSNGWYSALAPFGNNLTLIASIGPINNLTSIGSTVLSTEKFNISDQQAMRLPLDTDGDGIYDYFIQKDIEIKGGNLKGTAFVDVNNDGSLDYRDLNLRNATVVLRNINANISLEQITNEYGKYNFKSIYPGDYEISLFGQGREFLGYAASVTAGESSTVDIDIASSSIGGLVLTKKGMEIEAEVYLNDESNSTTISTRSNETGQYEFKGLMYGNYTLRAKTGDLCSVPMRTPIPTDASYQKIDLNVLPSGFIYGTAKLGANNAPHAILKIQSYDGVIDELVSSDGNGRYESILPEGTYSIYSTYYHQNTHFAFLGRMEIERNESLKYDVALEKSSEISGIAYQESLSYTKGSIKITFESSDGDGRVNVVTNHFGYYSVKLPNRNYEVKVSRDFYFTDTVALDGNRVYDIPLLEGEELVGYVYYDVNQNDVIDSGEELSIVNIGFTEYSSSRRIDAYTEQSGFYSVMLNRNESYTITVSVHGYEYFSEGPLNMTQIGETKNITLTPINVTLAGEVLYNNAPLSDYSVPMLFSPISEGAMEASALAIGAYEVSLRPGDYAIIIDYEVALREKYQNIDGRNISLEIGEESHIRNIEVVKKYELNGTIQLEGVEASTLKGIELNFEGPEHVSISSNDTFNVYLAEGLYSIWANFFYEEVRYQNISAINMVAPQDIGIQLEATVKVEGHVLYENNGIGENVSIAFERILGGLINTESSPDGRYEIYLSSGDYTAEVNHTTTELNGDLRYIRYLASLPLTVPLEGTITFDLNLTKVLNNATLYGIVFDSDNQTIGSLLEFYGLDNSAINTTFASDNNGEFSVSLHPGNYTLYTVHEDDVYLDTLMISPEKAIEKDIALEHGYRLEGILYRGLEPVEGNVTMEHQESGALLYVSTSSSGDFGLRLPGGEYNILFKTTIVERGMDVIYSNITHFELDVDQIIGMNLEKIKRYGVELYWDSAQKKKIYGNETVVYSIRLNNTGNEEDSYTLGGTPADWDFEFYPSAVSANFGDTDSSRIINVAITSPLNALVDHGELEISAHSENDSAISNSVVLEVDIFRYRGVELNLANETPMFAQNTVKYKFEVVNSGNDEDNYTVLIVNKPELESKGWNALINSSGNLVDRTNITISPNSKITLGLTIEIGFETSDVIILVYSNSDRGTDDILVISVSTPEIEMSKDDIDVEGEGLSLDPPDALASNILIIMIFITIATVIAIIMLRRKKKK